MIPSMSHVMAICRKYGITQKELAEAIDVHQSRISEWKRDTREVPRTALQRMYHVLGYEMRESVERVADPIFPTK